MTSFQIKRVNPTLENCYTGNLDVYMGESEKPYPGALKTTHGENTVQIALPQVFIVSCVDEQSKQHAFTFTITAAFTMDVDDQSRTNIWISTNFEHATERSSWVINEKLKVCALVQCLIFEPSYIAWLETLNAKGISVHDEYDVSLECIHEQIAMILKIILGVDVPESSVILPTTISD